MADVTIERDSELAKEVALLKSRNKTLSNIVSVDKDVLIKSKEQATAMGELGDNVKSIGNNLLSGAENLTSSIFGGSLGGVLNSLTIGMVKRRNENAKNEKEKAKEVAKATAEEKSTREKILNTLVDTLKLTDEHKNKSREQLEAMIKASELEKEIAAKNEEISKQKEEALALVGGESSFIGPLLPDGGRGGAESESPELAELRKIASGVETKEEKEERLRREAAKDKGGEVTKIKLESDEDAEGFSLKDIFTKDGRGKLITSLGGSLLGGATAAVGPGSDLAKNLGDKKKWGQLSKGAGFGLITAGLVSIAVGGIQGLSKAKEWGTGNAAATLGGMLGGIDKGAMGALKGAGKYALLGAGIGSVFPVIGTVIGGIAGALLGAILGYFGGERIAKVIDSMTSFFSDTWNSLLGVFGLDDKEQTKKKNIKDLEEEIEKTKNKQIKNFGVTGTRFTEEDKAAKLEELTKKLSTEKGRDISQEGKDAKLKSAQQKISQIKALMVHSKSDPSLIRNLKQAESEMMALDPSYKSTSLARGGFIVNQPTYLPNSGVVVGEHGTYSGGGAAYGGIADGGPEAVIPLSSTRAGAFIDPMARSVAGAVLNQLAMSRVGMDNSGGGGASVVTGNDMSSNQVSNNTTVINNPSPIGQTLPDEGRDFVSKVA